MAVPAPTPLIRPEYLIEAAGLGLFMVSATVCVALLEHPASPLHGWIASGDVRRALIGVAMGLTALALIYSPWGKRSGAHFNPAVTLTFFRLGKVAPRDLVGYVLAQFIGGTAGLGNLVDIHPCGLSSVGADSGQCAGEGDARGGPLQRDGDGLGARGLLVPAAYQAAEGSRCFVRRCALRRDPDIILVARNFGEGAKVA